MSVMKGTQGLINMVVLITTLVRTVSET